MVGYRPQHKTYKLVFADEDMDGLVVRVRSIRIGELRELLALVEIDLKHTSPGDAAKLDRLFEVFADALLSWNVEDDQGEPVPADLAGVSTQDGDFILLIVREWLRIFQVAGPLGNGSSDGGKSLEESLQMEPLSQSR